jgi:hypothetical protein
MPPDLQSPEPVVDLPPVAASVEPAKINPGTLQRTTLRTSRLLDFCSRKELIAQTGHQPEDWPLVVLKELADNSLDEQWTRQRYQFGAPGELAQPPAIREQCPEKRQRSLARSMHGGTTHTEC